MVMGEKKPMCCHLVLFCHLSCFTNLFNGLVLFVGGSYGWWLRQLLPLGLGWQDCQSLSHTPTPPTTAFTPCLVSIFSTMPFLPCRFTLTRRSVHILTLLVFPFTIMVCSVPPWSVLPHVGQSICAHRLRSSRREALCSPSRTSRGSSLVVYAASK